MNSLWIQFLNAFIEFFHWQIIMNVVIVVVWHESVVWNCDMKLWIHIKNALLTTEKGILNFSPLWYPQMKTTEGKRQRVKRKGDDQYFNSLTDDKDLIDFF